MNIYKALTEEYLDYKLEDDFKVRTIKERINRLDEPDKCLLLLYIDQKSIYKVGKMLNISPSTIYKNIIRIKKKICY